MIAARANPVSNRLSRRLYRRRWRLSQAQEMLFFLRLGSFLAADGRVRRWVNRLKVTTEEEETYTKKEKKQEKITYISFDPLTELRRTRHWSEIRSGLNGGLFIRTRFAESDSLNSSYIFIDFFFPLILGVLVIETTRLSRQHMGLVKVNGNSAKVLLGSPSPSPLHSCLKDSRQLWASWFVTIHIYIL